VRQWQGRDPSLSCRELTLDLLPTSSVRDPWARALIILLTVIAAIYLGQTVWALVAQVGDLLVLLIVAWLISFVLEPTVTALNAVSWMNRTASVVFVYFVVFLCLTSVVVLLAPVLALQAALAAEQIPSIVLAIEGVAERVSFFLSSRGVGATATTEQLLRPVESVGSAVVANAVTVATGAASAALQILLVIIISLYFMLDADRISGLMLAAVPVRYRDDFLYFTRSVNRAFGGFLRGQIIQAMVYGIGIAVMMVFLNLKFIALASVTAGIAMFIPFLGPTLGVIPPILAGLASETPNLWLVILLSIALNVFVVNGVAPKVMSQQIGLHPVVVLVAFLAGYRLAGPWGALLGVPVSAIAVTMFNFYQLTVAERKRHVRALTGNASEPTAQAAPPPVEATAQQIAEALAADAIPPEPRAPKPIP
jgi:predicted PurR-regulated permease PerM